MENPRTLTQLSIGRGSAKWLRLLGALWLAVGCAGIAPGAAYATETSTNTPATVRVSGFGLLGNRELARLLRNFQPGGKMPPVIDRSFVEDAALVLLARATEEGFLRARLRADFGMLDGLQQHFVWTNALEVTLPRTFAAHAARFKLEAGVRFHYQDIRFEGLKATSEREATGYFVSGEVLLNLHRNRVFSPRSLQSSLAALRETYARAGYQSAVVTTNQVLLNESSGAVNVTVTIQEGLPTIVRSVAVSVYDEVQDQPEGHHTLTPNKPYSDWWRQETSQKLQAAQYIKGFPDATVVLSELGRQTNAASIQVDLAARVQTGPKVTLGEVVFHGNQRTKTSVLESRVKLKAGEPLNRVAAEKSRQRLARLGVFESVGLSYDVVSETERRVVYELKEMKPLSLSTLAGYGSYELLRGGLEFQDRNLFGLAHNLRLRGIQSFKSSQGDLLHTVPEFLAENMELSLQGSGLRREEVSFTRVEYGGSLGIQKRLAPLQTEVGLRYNYEFLNALHIAAASPEVLGVEEARSAAFVLELNRDRRDHPLLPRRGSRLFSRAEFASANLGGNVDYQRFIFGASYHLNLRGGRLLHLGVTQGLTFTWGGTPDQLPFSKRFFPGGSDSARGYQEGEASPLDANGHQLGAETYTLGNLELEQLVTKSWSIVSFFDAVGFAQDRANYPWDEGLYSIGGGVRWRTPLGPVRLEYGHNLHRREHDPVGTLHFSIGFPF
jgi:outer membrane protein assembly complex protein YaeT